MYLKKVTTHGFTLKYTANMYLEFYDLKRSLLIDDLFPFCDWPFQFVRGSRLRGGGWRAFRSHKRRNPEGMLTQSSGAGACGLFEITQGERQDSKGKAWRCPCGGCVMVFWMPPAPANSFMCSASTEASGVTTTKQIMWKEITSCNPQQTIRRPLPCALAPHKPS